LPAGDVTFFHEPINLDGLIEVIRRTLGENPTSPKHGFETIFSI